MRSISARANPPLATLSHHAHPHSPKPNLSILLRRLSRRRHQRRQDPLVRGGAFVLLSQASEIWLTRQCADELREGNESEVSPKSGCLRRAMGEKYMETDTKVGSVTVT